MSRISDIFTVVRRKLADRAGERWADSDLIAYLNEAQTDICVETNVLRDIIAFYLVQDIHTYTLPEETLSVLRAEYKEEKLALKTTHYMDEKRESSLILQDFGVVSSFVTTTSHWQTQTTENDITLLVYDKLNRRKIRAWPTPTGANFVATVGDIYIPAGVDDADSSPYTPIADLQDKTVLVLRRSKKALAITETTLAEIETNSTTLEVDAICDKAIQNYMVALAFEDDIKETNRNIADRCLQKYYKELGKIQALVADDSVSSENFETIYNSMG